MADDQMTQNRNVQLNWLTINIPTIMSIGAAVLAIVVYITDLKADLQEMDAYRISRSKQTDENFADIRVQLAPLSTIPYRMTAAETELGDHSKRIDRIAETVIGALEVIRKDISNLNTTVQVQSSKIDQLADKVAEISDARKRASLDGTPSELRTR